MRRLGLQSMTQTLPYTAKYNSSLIVTELVQIFDTISNTIYFVCYMLITVGTLSLIYPFGYLQ
jgi:hypothetical protein